MIDIASTAGAAIGGGIAGAVIKLVAGLIGSALQDKQEARNERVLLAGKQAELLEKRPDQSGKYNSTTRRVLAWGVCFTFCAICLLWACFPGYPIIATGGTSTSGFNLFFFHLDTSRDLAVSVTTGAIVWQLIPFMSMILMTYFTPDLRK